QICAVVDHPRLEHQWLWDIFNAKKRQNVLIDDLFDETEDLPPPPPKQDMARPENVIDVPPPNPDLMGDEDFDVGDIPAPPKPLANWREALDGLIYDSAVMEITKLELSGVIGQELGKGGWKSVHSAPDMPDGGKGGTRISDESLRDAAKGA